MKRSRVWSDAFAGILSSHSDMIQQSFGKSVAVFTGRKPGDFFVCPGKIMAVRET